MINARAVIIAALLCLLIPINSITADAKPYTSSRSEWWAVLYPEYSGCKELKERDKKDVKVTFKLLEILNR